MIPLLKKIARVRYAMIPRPWYYGTRYRQISAFLSTSALWGEERMRHFQLERLRKIVSHAYNNTGFYRRLYDRSGVKPEDVRNYEDFALLPVVTRDYVVTHFEEFKAKNFASYHPILTQTSGTSGSPLTTYRSRETELYRLANVWRWRRAIGFDYRSRCVDFGPYIRYQQSDPTFEWDATENRMLLNGHKANRSHAEEIFRGIAD